MANTVVSLLELPFRAFGGLVTAILFPPKPLTPEEQLLKKVRGQTGQIRSLQEEISSLHSSLQERDSNERNLRDQLDKKEAEIDRLLKEIQDLENRLYQAWDRQRKR
jgi:septal ring factor EnvC (AmiA/AmiB activator)